MTPPSRFILPSWTLRDLWRWLMLLCGLLIMAHGLVGKYMRTRRVGTWKGEILKKPWQILLKRIWLVVIGVGFIVFALSVDNP